MSSATIQNEVKSLLQQRDRVETLMKNHKTLYQKLWEHYNETMRIRSDVHRNHFGGFQSSIRPFTVLEKEVCDELDNMMQQWKQPGDETQPGLPSTVQVNIVVDQPITEGSSLPGNPQSSPQGITKKVDVDQNEFTYYGGNTYAAAASQPRRASQAPYRQQGKGTYYVPQKYSVVNYSHHVETEFKTVSDYYQDWQEPIYEPNVEPIRRLPSRNQICPDGYFCANNRCKYYHTLRMTHVFKTERFRKLSYNDLENPSDETLNIIIEGIHEAARHFPTEIPRHDKSGLAYHENGARYYAPNSANYIPRGNRAVSSSSYDRASSSSSTGKRKPGNRSGSDDDSKSRKRI